MLTTQVFPRHALDSRVRLSGQPLVPKPDLTDVMLSETKHPRMRTTTDTWGKQTHLLCFGDFGVDAHPAILHFVQDDRLRLVKC